MATTTLPRVSLQATLAIVALASAAAVIAAPRSPQREHFLPGDHPAAILAWASTRCGSGVTLAPRAAKAHAEDVMMVSAAFENAARFRSMADVCYDAFKLAGTENEATVAVQTRSTRRLPQAEAVAIALKTNTSERSASTR